MLFDTHSRGGLDVTLAINLFFKAVLLFPIFLFAGYVGIAMMKHMIFHGIPVMNSVTEEQQEILRDRDSRVGLPPTLSPSEIRSPPSATYSASTWTCGSLGNRTSHSLSEFCRSMTCPHGQVETTGCVPTAHPLRISIGVLIMFVETFEGLLFYCAEE